MRRLRSLTLTLAPTALLIAIVTHAGRAKADVTLFDRDGWTFRTNGLIAAHYQLVKGDVDPGFGNRQAAGGQILDETSAGDMRTGQITLSDIRSGFVGTQIGFGVDRQISPTVRIESLLAINMNGINSNRGQNLQKDVDYREAWAQIVSPYGTVRFGRMFGMFGEGSAEVMMMAYHYGVGHPCVINSATIACGSSGAGPLYAGFDGAIRYISPRLGGLQLALSIVDPSVSPFAKMSPTPRVDGEANYDQTFGAVHVRALGQSLFEQISSSTSPASGGTLTKDTIWGLMGTGIVSFADHVTVGGGVWVGSGIGERVPLEAENPGDPIFTDNSGHLRNFRGYYGNAQLHFGAETITGGGGALFVQPTTADKDEVMSPVDVLDNNVEFHVTFNHRIDAIVLNAEFMHWKTAWHFGEKQSLNFMGAGVNYLW